MLATPPGKDKSPENNAAGEDENASTDTENPTEIDLTEAMQSSREQPHEEETHPDETDDAS